MKKLLLLPVLLFFASCSTDDTALTATQNDLKKSRFGSSSYISNACLTSVSGSVTADLSQGINNPVFLFTGYLTGYTSSVIYKTTIEIEALSDCEDVNSGTGEVVSFSAQDTRKVPAAQNTISIGLQSLPNFPCYRWRVVVYGVSTVKGIDPCTTVSEWYEAPLL